MVFIFPSDNCLARLVWSDARNGPFAAEVAGMSEMVEVLAGTSLLLLAFSLLIFGIPRSTLPLVHLRLCSRQPRSAGGTVGEAAVSLRIPPVNAGAGHAPQVSSLRRRPLGPGQIIGVD